MSLISTILVESLRMLVLAAPFLLLGLFAAGLLHVLMPARVIERWLGRPGLSGVVAAALLGVPLPVCSCGVVPIAVELRRQKASAPASLSFLTTTPESGVDSILFTWGLMGPVVAIARPLAAFASAILGGVLAIAYLPEPEEGGGARQSAAAAAAAAGDDAPTQAELPRAVAHDAGGERAHGHDHDPAIVYERSGEARRALAVWLRSLAGIFKARPAPAAATGAGAPAAGAPAVASEPEAAGGGEAATASAAPAAGRPGLWRPVLRPALRYGFGELLDELAFWLLLGVLLAGVLGAVLPADLAERGLGGGLAPMLLMLIIGIPLYVCASASTPIAAALVAKGLSPGAALVFLLAGPATNAVSMVMLGRTFGRRFVKIQVASVAAGALAAGLALDALIALFGWQVAPPVAAAIESTPGALGVVSALILGLLLARSFRRGALRTGWGELTESLAGLARALPGGRGRWIGLLIGRRSLAIAAAVLTALAWLASGFRVVPPDARGFALVFGALSEAEYGPGLHWLPPAPIGELEVRRVAYARKTDVGFRTDLEMLARRAELTRFNPPDEWHSPVAAMNPDREQAAYLTADENLLELSFTVHYALADPVAFFYRVDHTHDFVELYAEAAARRLLAGRVAEELMTLERAAIEDGVQRALQERLDALGAGIAVTAVRIVDIHPPGESVFDFRDVSSAREDRETTVHQAHRRRAAEVPRARGEAALIVGRAEAAAGARVAEAAGRSEGFSARAAAVAPDRALLEHLLWLESAERSLAGRDKVIVPPGSGGGEVSLWRRRE